MRQIPQMSETYVEPEEYIYRETRAMVRSNHIDSLKKLEWLRKHINIALSVTEDTLLFKEKNK